MFELVKKYVKFSRLVSLRGGLTAALMTAITLAPGQAQPASKSEAGAAGGLANCHVLIIRHADKSDGGDGLSADGIERAKRYVKYFNPYIDGDKKIVVDYLVATADSAASKRPRLTLTPLSKALGLPIQHDFADKDVKALAADLATNEHGHNILIAWHHGEIHKLIKELGGDWHQVLDGTYIHGWPDDVYNWVVELDYDASGNVTSQKRVTEPF